MQGSSRPIRKLKILKMKNLQELPCLASQGKFKYADLCGLKVGSARQLPIVNAVRNQRSCEIRIAQPAKFSSASSSVRRLVEQQHVCAFLEHRCARPELHDIGAAANEKPRRFRRGFAWICVWSL
jgi:hypothetical protein